MQAVAAALSLSSQIEKYGAYAGIAAVVGLGLLAVLYAAQAREVKRLREWAGRAPERDADLQQRVVAEAQRRTVPVRAGGPASPATPAAQAAKAAQPGAQPAAPAATPAGQAAAAPGAAPAAAPAAAAGGVAAAAAAGAAAAKPATGQASGAEPAAKPATPAAPGAPATTPASPPAAGGQPTTVQPAAAAGTTSPTPSASPATPPSPTPSAAPAPSSASPAAAGTAAAAAATTRPPAARPAGSPSSATPAPTPSAARPRTAAAAARPRAEATVPPGGGSAPAGSRRGLVGVIVGGVVIVGIAILLITQVFGGSDSSTPSKPNSIGGTSTGTQGGGSTSTSTTPAAAPDRSTQVAVLNGTTVTGLARAAADKLTGAGYKQVGPVTTDTSNQQRPATVIFYEPSARREALDAAKVVGVGRGALQAMDQNARVLGGGAPVVVIVGADQAQ